MATNSSSGKIIAFPAHKLRKSSTPEDTVTAAIQTLKQEIAHAPVKPNQHKREADAKERTAPSSITDKSIHQSIGGRNNVGVIGSGNHVQITVHGVRPSRPQVMPGDKEVTNEQAAEIKRLVGEVVKQSGFPFPRVYGTLYRRFEATSYQMIKRHRFQEAVTYLHQWIARTSQRSAPTNTKDARKRMLSRIHVQANKMGGSLGQIHAYIMDRFGTQTLADLTLGQLHEVIREFRL